MLKRFTCTLITFMGEEIFLLHDFDIFFWPVYRSCVNLFFRINFAEFDGSVQRRRFFAWECVFWVVACQCALVKDGLVAANEAPLLVLDDGDLVLAEDGHADVEDLAVVGRVGVVVVVLALAGEAGVNGTSEVGLDLGRELVATDDFLWRGHRISGNGQHAKNKNLGWRHGGWDGWCR